MKISRIFAVMFAFLGAFLCSIPCSAADIYIAQVAQGADNGTNAANAHSVAWFNTIANWGGGSTQIGPGCTVHICGIVTNSITFQTGGSPGNPIVLLFEPNAKFSAPTWTANNGNIITAASNVTIDGGTNGIIEATSNGTGLSYQNWCVGISASCANNLLVKNLTIRNLYVRTRGGEQNGYGVGVANSPSSAPYGYTNMVVTNCVIHDMYMGVSCNYGTGGCTNLYIEGCIITNINWGVQCGDVSSGSICDHVYIQNNIIGNFMMWDDTTSDSFHHNGAYCWAQLNSSFYHCIVSGNTVFGYGTYNTSGFYFSGNSGSTVGMVGPVYVYNNIFDDPNGSASNGSLFFLPNAGFMGIFANNDVFGNSWANGLDWDAVYGGSQNVLFYNNIISNAMAEAIFDDASAVLKSDYDDLAGPPSGGDWFSASGNNSAGFQSLVTWVLNGFDQHSITGNPDLNSSFIPQPGSPLIAAGTNLYNFFTTDMNGNPRPSIGAWTIGACVAANTNLAPAISVTPASQNFGAVAVGVTTNSTFNVQNTGGGALTGSASVSAPFSIVSGGSYSLGAGQSQTVTVSYSPTAAGTNSQTVTFTGAAGGSGTVSGTAVAPPVVSAITQSGADVDTTASGLQIFAGSVVQYSGSASDPNGLPLTWQWSYTLNGGPETVVLSGTGSVASVSFNYTASTAGNTYAWALVASNGYSTAESTLNVGVEAPPPATASLTFQANNAVVTAPFVLNNGYISQSVQTTDPTTGGEAVFTFTITNAGTYVIQALVNAPTDANNSFYVNVDAQPSDPTNIWDIPITSGFEQQMVSWRGNGTDGDDQFVPAVFTLSAGVHQLIVRGREMNTQLQSLAILDYVTPPANLHIVSP